MTKFIPAVTVAVIFAFIGLFGYFAEYARTAPTAETGTLEKLIVSSGEVSIKLDLNRLNGLRANTKAPKLREIRFDTERDSFFTVIVFEDALRGPIPSEMPINPTAKMALPSRLGGAFDQLVIERTLPGEQYEYVVRDRKSWFPFFNIEGHEMSYEPENKVFSVKGGRLLVTERFAAEIGDPDLANTAVGEINISARMRPIEIVELRGGEIISDVMPAMKSGSAGSVPGPDVVVGDVYGLAQFGSSGSQVGLALGTVSCNYGEQDLNWIALPNNDHPVIPQNLYRMSGGANNDERFEQISQSSVKHAFTALTQNLCSLGCNGVGGSHLGSGCSDPYSASLNAGPDLGSRAWIDPFTGSFPRGDSANSPNDHGGHSHNGVSHRMLAEIADLDTAQNAGATYWAEGQYVTPHEYSWCHANPGQCNMYNNVSYRQYEVTGTTNFTFSAAGTTVRAKPAIEAWTGATVVPIEPDPGNDGIGAVAYKVTNVGPGVWHYEYAVYNQNLDRAIRSFSVPVGAGAGISSIGFHAPPQHPGWSNDGTVDDAGFSSAPWTQTLGPSSMTWSSETFAENQNANAIRWGTMYNFRFDSDIPPEMANATVGFFKIGSPINVQILAPVTVPIITAGIAGRVMTPEGWPLKGFWVVVTASGGDTYTAVTNNFGRYQIAGIAPGTGFTVSALGKGHTFTPQVMDINGNLTGVNLVADP